MNSMLATPLQWRERECKVCRDCVVYLHVENVCTHAVVMAVFAVHESLIVHKSNVCATSWMDKKVVMLMSTGIQPTTCTVLRRKKDGFRTQVPCPQPIIDYNTYMGGVDRGDQIRGYYSCITECSLIGIFYTSSLIRPVRTPSSCRSTFLFLLLTKPSSSFDCSWPKNSPEITAAGADLAVVWSGALSSSAALSHNKSCGQHRPRSQTQEGTM